MQAVKTYSICYSSISHCSISYVITIATHTLRLSHFPQDESLVTYYINTVRTLNSGNPVASINVLLASDGEMFAVSEKVFFL